MAKPLSQEEIDILLQVRSQIGGAEAYDMNALESITRTEAQERINPYNFKRPRLFSQDQMRLLNHVHEAFARDISVYLSAQLRTIVDITLTAVDQVLYSEYVMSSAPPSALYVAEMDGHGHRLIFELDPRLVIFTIEKLFGGQGQFLKKPREVSQIEQRVMSKVMKRMFGELEKSWKQVFEFTLTEDTFESNAEFVQIIPSVEAAFVCIFEVTVYDQSSFITICYPYMMLERILNRTNVSQWISRVRTEVSQPVRDRYEVALRAMNVEVRAELGKTSLSAADVLGLEVGDVIPLRRKVSDPVDVYVGKKQTLTAAPGKSGKHRALQVIDIVALPVPEEEEDELR